MRNLKKVLALALATVMLLGMMAMASAKEYVDAADINANYGAAIDVMAAIGALEGTPDGKFNPTEGLTRAQAAAIATRVALTRETADHVTAVEDPFTDVAMENWAAGYVVAAKNLGLVDGMGDGTFAPTAGLKGYQFAKMLLCVLGYDAAAEGYIGSAWEYNVNKDARAAGLLAGLTDIKLNAYITREEAAQMAFNALFADMVEYDGSTSMIVNGVVIEQKGKLEKTGEKLAEDVYEITAGEKLDEFGYSYKTWTIDDEEVAAAKNYTVIATYTGDLSALTNGALYATTKKAEAIAYYVNGADTHAGTVTPKKDGTDKQLAAYTGAVVEFVKNDGVYQLLIAEAEVATVASVTAAAGEAKRYITIDEKKYETEDFAKDEVVFVWKNATEIVKVAKAEAVTGTATQVEGVNGTKLTGIYLDGTKYAVAGTEAALSAATVTLGEEYNVYFQNGYAIAASLVDEEEAEETLADYVYVVKQDTEKVEKADTAFGADASDEPDAWETQIVYMDGTVAIVKAAAQIEAGKVYKMGENTDGLKTFTTGEFGVVVSAVTLNETKVGTYAGEKLYYTADSKVLTITTKASGFAKEAALSAVPAKATIANAFLVYSLNSDAKVYEIERIITASVDAGTADDLYYVVGTVLGTIYDATAKKSYNQIAAYEVATGTKLTVNVATTANYANGYYNAEITDGIYAFEDAIVTGYAEYITTAKKDITTYGGMLFVKGQLEDMDYADVVVIDIKGGAVDTIDELVAKSAEKATVKFETVTYDEVVYIVVINY